LKPPMSVMTGTIDAVSSDVIFLGTSPAQFCCCCGADNCGDT
jgi:hypothetical protein